MQFRAHNPNCEYMNVQCILDKIFFQQECYCIQFIGLYKTEIDQG